jgi:cytochrome c biogenesis protein
MIKGAGSYRIAISSIGSPLLHIGVLLLVAGMVTAQFTGFEDNATLAVGGSYTREGMDFEVRLDSFQIIYDEDYNITDYISTVTVMEDGKEVLTGEITVNNPLEYEGVKFYQSTYGWAVGVKIAETETGEILLDNVLDMDVSTKGIGSVEYSMYDEESGTSITQQFIVIPDQASEGTVNTLSPLPNNPALFFVLYYGSDISIIQDVALGESEDIGGLTISFEGLDYYSGLSVSSKPELPVVFIGSIVFMVGLIIVFCMRKKV